MPRHPDVLISDSDRELVAVQLRNAHVEGRLTLEQLRHRIGLLGQATNQADVTALVSDLPSPDSDRRAPVPTAQAVQTVPSRLPANHALMRQLWTAWLSLVSVGLVLGALETVAPGTIPYLAPGGSAWHLLADLWLIVTLTSGAVLASVSAVRRLTGGRGRP
ncbi:DUF1707 SHOCT-like domain-containing protein [Flindersiella endophytica]